MMNINVHKMDISGIDAELKVALQKYNISIWSTSRREVDRTGAGCNKLRFMGVTPNGRQIVIVTDDIKNAGLTLRELESMIWHEIGHIALNTENEHEADVYAITHIGVIPWQAAIVKTWMVCCEASPSKKWQFSEKYSHRRKYVRIFLEENGFHVPEWV